MNNEPTISKQSKKAPANRRAIVWMIAMLVLWSLLIAAGSFWFGESLDVRKPAIVLGTMSAFVGVWLFALRGRS